MQQVADPVSLLLIPPQWSETGADPEFVFGRGNPRKLKVRPSIRRSAKGLFWAENAFQRRDRAAILTPEGLGRLTQVALFSVVWPQKSHKFLTNSVSGNPWIRQWGNKLLQRATKFFRRINIPACKFYKVMFSDEALTRRHSSFQKTLWAVNKSPCPCFRAQNLFVSPPLLLLLLLFWEAGCHLSPFLFLRKTFGPVTLFFQNKQQIATKKCR